MEQALNPPLAARRPVARIALARLLQTIGWSGVAGLLLMLVSAGILQSAWGKRAEAREERDELATVRAAPVSTIHSDIPAAPGLPKLPRYDEIPLLLTRMERAATTNGLPWAAGEYRLLPASGAQAPSLEVRFGFKAPYPKVRAMLADVIGSVPAMAVREMSLTRTSVESADVDAKLAVAIFLADDAGQSSTAVAPSTGSTLPSGGTATTR